MGIIATGARAWALAAMLAVNAGPAGAAPAEALTKADRKALVEIDAAVQKSDCGTILKKGEPLVRRRAGALPGDLAASLHGLMAGCYLDAKRSEEARGAALRGTALPESTPQLWYVRLSAEQEMKRYDDVAVTLEAMSQGHGAALNDIQLPWLFGILRTMKEAGAAKARLRVLKLLAGDSYAPSETFGSNDEFRFIYVKDRLEAGDTAAAAPALRQLEAPHNIAAASLDPRMRGYLPSADVGAAAEKMLARHREWIARQPERLRPIIAAAANLRQLGRAEEALALLKSAEPRLGKLTPEEDKDQVNWWWNEMASVYESLGRTDDATRAYRMGMTADEDGEPNVSQLINLALAQNRYGRPADALQTLAVKDLSASGASPYGTMLYRKARACALHLLGRGAEAAADLDYIESHEKDAPVAVTGLHLCLGDMDSAAASAVRRLGDPETRTDMLLELSDYTLGTPPLRTDKEAANLEALDERADVKAAVAKAGGTRRFNIAEL